LQFESCHPASQSRFRRIFFRRKERPVDSLFRRNRSLRALQEESTQPTELVMPRAYCVALPFARTKDGIADGQAQECQSAPEANRKAEAMSSNPLNVGALAFMRTCDPSSAILRTLL